MGKNSEEYKFTGSLIKLSIIIGIIIGFILGILTTKIF